MSFSVSEVLSWVESVGGRLVNADALGPALNQIRIERPSELGRARSTDLAFFFNKNYQTDLLASSPGVLITGEPFVRPLEASGLPLWKKTAVIACADPYLAMALCSKHLALKLSSVVHPIEAVTVDSKPEIHSSTIVHATAEIGLGVEIGPNCVIEEGAKIGDGCILYSGCYVGSQVKLGKNCVLFPNVTLYECTEVGNRVRLHAGVVLGADGFGYAPLREGQKVVGYEKIYHLGKVVVGDDVEIGANTCIDRGTLGETRVDRGAKVDDLVMIGHNCIIEEGAVICGKAGLAGRAHVGKFATIGGAAGLANDVHIGDGAVVAGHTLISKDVPPGMVVVGNPHREQKDHFRIQAMLNKMLKERESK